MEAGVRSLLMRALTRADGDCQRIRFGAYEGRMVGQPSEGPWFVRGQPRGLVGVVRMRGW